MKRLLLMLLLACSAWGQVTYIGPVVPPLPGYLKGYWLFNENTGTTAGDSSGTGYDLTLTNGPGWVASKAGYKYAVSCTAAQSQYCKKTVANPYPDQQGGIFVWIKIASSGANKVIFSSSDEATILYSFLFWISANDSLRLTHIDNVTANDAMRGIYKFNNDTWYHVGVTSNGSHYTFYVNGDTIPSIAVAGANTGDWLGDIANRDHADWGARERPTTDLYWDGCLDQCMYYNTPPEGWEVKQLYMDTQEGHINPKYSADSTIIGGLSQDSTLIGKQ